MVLICVMKQGPSCSTVTGMEPRLGHPAQGGEGGGGVDCEHRAEAAQLVRLVGTGSSFFLARGYCRRGC